MLLRLHRRGNPHLVVLTPGPGSGSVETEKDEGILTTDDEQDGEELQVGDQVTDTPEERSQLSTGVLLLLVQLVLLHTVVKHTDGTKIANNWMFLRLQLTC